MKRKTTISAAMLLLGMILLCAPHGSRAAEVAVRPSPLAGAWYPDDAGALQRMINGYLSQADPPRVPEQIVALISPHAGYVYSGQAAASGFKAIEDHHYARVFIIGPSHYARFRGVAVSSFDRYATPLGSVPVDTSVGSELSAHPLFQYQRSAELREHALEMQIPFLQTVLDGFSIVPLLVGELGDQDYAQIREQLAPYISDSTLVVVSTDFTHYGKKFGYVPFRGDIKKNLHDLDRGSIDHILRKDAPGFRRYVADTGITICGRRAVSLLLSLLADNTAGTLLSYYTSGDQTGDYSFSVSYASILFYRTAEDKGRPVANQR